MPAQATSLLSISHSTKRHQKAEIRHAFIINSSLLLACSVYATEGNVCFPCAAITRVRDTVAADSREVLLLNTFKAH